MKARSHSIFGLADVIDTLSLGRIVSSYLIVVTISLFIGCENSSEPYVPNIAGTWTGTAWGSAEKESLTLTIHQDGNRIWGEDTLASGATGKIFGAMRGELCEFTFYLTNYSSAGCAYHYAVLYHGNSASGDYSTGDCGVRASGKVYLTKVK